MVQNQTVLRQADPTETRSPLWCHVGTMSGAPEDAAQNIELVGGIWNCSNLQQNPNPIQTRVFEPTGYTGFGMLFYNVRGLKLSSLTLKDPVNFAVTLDRVTDFTVEDITFDFNYGNPKALNMDGIHLNGNCHRGVVRNLKGACYDDLVALNADEGSDGPISDIVIDGIFAEDCHSAVRMLTVKNRVENIHISRVFGSYYQYCIALTKYYPGEVTGHFDAITLAHIYAVKAERLPVYCKEKSRVHAIIWVQSKCRVGTMRICDLRRREKINPVETIHIGHDAVVDRLVLDDIYIEHEASIPMALLVNHGTVDQLIARDTAGVEGGRQADET